MSDVAVFDPSEPSRRGHGSTFVVILKYRDKRLRVSHVIVYLFSALPVVSWRIMHFRDYTVSPSAITIKSSNRKVYTFSARMPIK